MKGYRFAGVTDKGKVRSSNEDIWFALEEFDLFVVADGMGALGAGEEAARLIQKNLPRRLDEERSRLGAIPTDPERASDLLRESIRAVNADFEKLNRVKPRTKRLGAAFVALMINPAGKGVVTNLGDSRAYLFRDGKLTQLSKDHSIVQVLLDNGELDPSEAKTHPAKNQLTRFIGMNGTALADMAFIDFRRGDRALLCSDGLTKMLTPESIERMLKKVSGPSSVCRDLVDAANANGGSDNITALLIDWIASDGEVDISTDTARTVRLELNG